MPTPASRADSIPAPAWLVRLLTPFIARAVAREMIRKYPGLGAAEIGERMRAELPSGLDAAEGARLVAAVVARLPNSGVGQEAAKPVSVWVLVAANLLPLYAVLFLGWEVFPLLVLFWMENVIVGALNAARMLLLDPRDAPFWAAKLFMVPFFCFHYGMFTAIHGVFVLSLFGHSKTRGFALLEPAMQAVQTWNLWLPAGALLASHLFSFSWNYLYRGEFRRASLPELMMQPYTRVMILHLSILLGGFGVMALGSPLWALLVLIGVKIAIDLRAHLKEHRV